MTIEKTHTASEMPVATQGDETAAAAAVPARLDFWSRRKAAVKAEREAEVAAVRAEEVTKVQQELEVKSDEEILEELELPDPDQMEAGDDFSAFMSEIVPDRIRRRALRKLWLTNPTLANVDGLVDYGEDFTDATKVIENLQSTYQVGKGMLSHILEMQRQEAEEAAEGESDDAQLELDASEDDAVRAGEEEQDGNADDAADSEIAALSPDQESGAIPDQSSPERTDFVGQANQTMAGQSTDSDFAWEQGERQGSMDLSLPRDTLTGDKKDEQIILMSPDETGSATISSTQSHQRVGPARQRMRFAFD